MPIARLNPKKAGVKPAVPTTPAKPAALVAPALRSKLRVAHDPDAPGYFAGDLFHMTPKPFIVSKMFVEESFNLIIGPKKTGKTLVTVDLAVTLAAGLTEWAGHNVTRRHRGGLVIYVLGEGVSRFGLRLRAALATHDIDAHAFAQDESFFLVPKALNLLDADAVKLFLDETVTYAEAQSGKSVSLIVFDTWSRCVTGAENDEAFNMAVGHVDLIRRTTGATIIALHHTPKDGRTTARGSGVLEGAVDSQFSVSGDTRAALVEVDLEFSRDIAADQFATKVLEKRTIQFDDHPDPDTGEPEAAPALRLLSNDEGQERVVEDIRTAVLAHLGKGPASGTQMSKTLRRRKDSVQGVCMALSDQGLIESVGEGPRMRWQLKAS